ncbi:hypothetical protein CROQUDRAFT_658328 [Cronartium quercuum f. sp. fusiforme G11]|uniref:UBX domain-containing protein n=1 Tax=Cronartium quercuum f. sp. fusiforme G11 TaxID=708437 RepID=A0A9P6TCI5_9BASI|nr:hypothetical protein CROQUDRAFT_658328 [Cronartium quercuum f. sp. fusiforme G11]
MDPSSSAPSFEPPQPAGLRTEITDTASSASLPSVQPAVTEAGKQHATDIKIWKPSADARPPPRPELPDNYFVPTAAEAQRAFQGQVATRERLNDGPMLTKSLREREQSQKLNQRYARFPVTRIRVRFSDRTMLEGAFQSNSTMKVVYAFVKASLKEEVRSQAFILYQTPPRREFKLADPKIGSSTLLDLQLTPSSLFYIKFTDDALNQTQRTPPLLPELLANAQDLPPPPNVDQGTTESSSSISSAIGKGKQKLDDALKNGAKAPKWLQNLKKK